MPCTGEGPASCSGTQGVMTLIASSRFIQSHRTEGDFMRRHAVAFQQPALEQAVLSAREKRKEHVTFVGDDARRGALCVARRAIGMRIKSKEKGVL